MAARHPIKALMESALMDGKEIIVKADGNGRLFIYTGTSRNAYKRFRVIVKRIEEESL